jgi:hypothetical protein
LTKEARGVGSAKLRWRPAVAILAEFRTTTTNKGTETPKPKFVYFWFRETAHPVASGSKGYGVSF